MLKLFLLLIALLTTSCAYRYKGNKGIQKLNTDPSIALSEGTTISYYGPSEGYVLNTFIPSILTRDKKAEWKIEKIIIDRAPSPYFCGTGYVLPMLVSVASLGIIPISDTSELSGYMTVYNKKRDIRKRVKLHAKMVASFSIWNRFKIGKDEEWTSEQRNRVDYFKDYIQSKVQGK